MANPEEQSLVSSNRLYSRQWNLCGIVDGQIGQVDRFRYKELQDEAKRVAPFLCGSRCRMVYVRMHHRIYVEKRSVADGVGDSTDWAVDAD